VTTYHRSMGITGRHRCAAVAALAVLALSGCGSDSSSVAQDPGTSSPTASATSGGNPPQGPTCDHVWRDGATLPHDYRGCADAGSWVKAEVYQCSDGHRLVTYAHAFYASPGRRITQAAKTLAQDQEFQHTMAVCGA
jgi:hypothetical protein